MKFKESKSIYLQDFITYPVSYLQVNGFTFFKFHLLFLGLWQILSEDIRFRFCS